MPASQKQSLLRSIGLIAALPSGMALLLHIWGIAPLHDLALWTFVPSALLLLWVGAQSLEVRTSMLVGAVGGLLGTFGYDLFRVPFMLAGKRVFAPISAYGVWLLDADSSSTLTELVGWGYHFSNGITFGIIYALIASKRSWKWAVLWGLGLETIVVISPFADAFALTGAYGALAIAYAGHIAYGYPLGKIVERPTQLMKWLKGLPKGAVVFVVGLIMLGGISLFARAPEVPKLPISFVASEDRLSPSWLRIQEPSAISVLNLGESNLIILNHASGAEYPLASGETITIDLSKPGIVQLSLTGAGRTRSSFVIVEPVFPQR